MYRRANGCLIRFLRVFLILVVLCAPIVTFRPVYAAGESMQPTVQSGDWLLVCRLARPKRGDIVLTGTDNPSHARMIKRLIAVGGDTVDIDFSTGTVTVNGQALDEPYISGDGCDTGNVSFPLTVPEGKVFLLGDNRTNSFDSRFEEIGCVDKKCIIGPVFLHLLPTPVSFM